jgi:hypothetical protein
MHMSSTESRYVARTGWATFAAIWLVIAGSFNVVEGITAIHRGNYLANEFLFSNQDTWGWILLIFGLIQLVAGFMVFSDNPNGNLLGVCAASFAIFIWFFFLFAAPLGALIALIVNGLVIYGLTTGREP